METFSAGDAKKRFTELLRRASAGEQLTITLHGQGVATLAWAVKPDWVRQGVAGE